MDSRENKEKFVQGLNTVRSSFDQLEVLCREVKSENDILWDVILAYGNEALWQKLFIALANYNGEDGPALIVKKIRELLEHNQYSLAFLGLNHLVAITYTEGEEPSEFVQISVSSILDLMFAMNIPDLDEMDRLLMDTMNWMKKTAHSPLRDSVHEFIHGNHARLNQLIADTNSPELILEYLHTLLAFDFYYPLKGMMAYILGKEWPFLDAKIQEKQYVHFLWIAFYISMDDVLVEASGESRRFIEQAHTPEMLIYKKYCAMKSGGECNRQTTEDIIALMAQSRMFEEHEKTKLWEEISKFLEPLAEASVTMELPTQLPTDMKKASSIWQLKNKTDHCPHCSQSQLVKELVIVDGFKKHSVPAYKPIVFELLTCILCSRIYAYDSTKRKLNNALEPYRCIVQLDPIDYPPKQLAVKPVASPKRVVITPTTTKTSTTSKAAVTNEYFAWPSTEARESQGKSDRESNFRDETQLHRLGYKITGLNRMKRWDILVRKVIPKMTLKEIVNTIANNVRLRKSQEGGHTKFAYAIAEWEHDLERLKQEYYSSNFTWPQY
ncbi:hypothetical protein OB236_32390 [Paenibacillus sp. WQ 127069]|uniref:Uncharacterized protein n=1 Tax=Paenibacillus baimaensis TaxID=2982185 RepID=A0ABT2UQ92_9BACL|nr:hypothetical protein [Paenibacillus sp. WQ 127069]MCU6796835.1 hypothetical protein [Paenibacillus sp. WQ 127069]